MDEQDWCPTDRILPEEGKVVWAMDSGGHVQTLKLSSGLWWFPDGSMYVYFTPLFWKDVV